MTLITTLLEIDAIEYAIPPGFGVDSAKIDQLAQAFLAAKGSINPILVREITPIQFALIEGYTEMLAAVRASEIDRNFAEIRAIVVPPEALPSVQAQVELLRRDLLQDRAAVAVEGMQLDAVLKAITQLDRAQQQRFHQLDAVVQAIAQLEKKLEKTKPSLSRLGRSHHLQPSLPTLSWPTAIALACPNCCENWPAKPYPPKPRKSWHRRSCRSGPMVLSKICGIWWIVCPGLAPRPWPTFWTGGRDVAAPVHPHRRSQIRPRPSTPTIKDLRSRISKMPWSNMQPMREVGLAIVDVRCGHPIGGIHPKFSAISLQVAPIVSSP
ncbi:MAG: hypothetical protein HC918_09085 [Oscillatoriales cyanobacterium SM2_1_8]|nr:hypothetical protein [Oscillatoriales cyanobacterium SM2_1_8]